MSAPLLIGPEVVANLAELRARARLAPIDMQHLLEVFKTPDGRRHHHDAMTSQSTVIPGIWPFFVTYSVETGHPAGMCRHMSMRAERHGRAPSPEAVWMVARHMGFVRGLIDCTLWLEDLSDGGVAVNIVQPFADQDGTDP